MSDELAGAEQIRAAQSMAHRAVTEGVNLKYVELLRREIYAMCDLAESLAAALSEAETRAQLAEEVVEIVRARRARFAAKPYAFSHPRSPEEVALDEAIEKVPVRAVVGEQPQP